MAYSELLIMHNSVPLLQVFHVTCTYHTCNTKFMSLCHLWYLWMRLIFHIPHSHTWHVTTLFKWWRKIWKLEFSLLICNSDVSTTEIHTSNDFTVYNVPKLCEAKRKLVYVIYWWASLKTVIVGYCTSYII